MGAGAVERRSGGASGFGGRASVGSGLPSLEDLDDHPVLRLELSLRVRIPFHPELLERDEIQTTAADFLGQVVEEVVVLLGPERILTTRQEVDGLLVVLDDGRSLVHRQLEPGETSFVERQLITKLRVGEEMPKLLVVTDGLRIDLAHLFLSSFPGLLPG